MKGKAYAGEVVRSLANIAYFQEQTLGQLIEQFTDWTPDGCLFGHTLYEFVQKPAILEGLLDKTLPDDLLKLFKRIQQCETVYDFFAENFPPAESQYLADRGYDFSSDASSSEDEHEQSIDIAGEIGHEDDDHDHHAHDHDHELEVELEPEHIANGLEHGHDHDNGHHEESTPEIVHDVKPVAETVEYDDSGTQWQDESHQAEPAAVIQEPTPAALTVDIDDVDIDVDSHNIQHDAKHAQGLDGQQLHDAGTTPSDEDVAEPELPLLQDLVNRFKSAYVSVEDVLTRMRMQRWIDRILQHTKSLREFLRLPDLEFQEQLEWIPVSKDRDTILADLKRVIGIEQAAKQALSTAVVSGTATAAPSMEDIDMDAVAMMTQAFDAFSFHELFELRSDSPDLRHMLPNDAARARFISITTLVKKMVHDSDFQSLYEVLQKTQQEDALPILHEASIDFSTLLLMSRDELHAVLRRANLKTSKHVASQIYNYLVLQRPLGNRTLDAMLLSLKLGNHITHFHRDNDTVKSLLSMTEQDLVARLPKAGDRRRLLTALQQLQHVSNNARLAHAISSLDPPAPVLEWWNTQGIDDAVLTLLAPTSSDHAHLLDTRQTVLDVLLQPLQDEAQSGSSDSKHTDDGGTTAHQMWSQRQLDVMSEQVFVAAETFSKHNNAEQFPLAALFVTMGIDTARVSDALRRMTFADLLSLRQEQLAVHVPCVGDRMKLQVLVQSANPVWRQSRRYHLASLMSTLVDRMRPEDHRSHWQKFEDEGLDDDRLMFMSKADLVQLFPRSCADIVANFHRKFKQTGSTTAAPIAVTDSKVETVELARSSANDHDARSSHMPTGGEGETVESKDEDVQFVLSTLRITTHDLTASGASTFASVTLDELLQYDEHDLAGVISRSGPHRQLYSMIHALRRMRKRIDAGVLSRDVLRSEIQTAVRQEVEKSQAQKSGCCIVM
jgi:SAM domain (Sterile alpha motif)